MVLIPHFAFTRPAAATATGLRRPPFPLPAATTVPREPGRSPGHDPPPACACRVRWQMRGRCPSEPFLSPCPLRWPWIAAAHDPIRPIGRPGSPDALPPPADRMRSWRRGASLALQQVDESPRGAGEFLAAAVNDSQGTDQLVGRQADRHAAFRPPLRRRRPARAGSRRRRRFPRPVSSFRRCRTPSRPGLRCRATASTRSSSRRIVRSASKPMKFSSCNSSEIDAPRGRPGDGWPDRPAPSAPRARGSHRPIGTPADS